MRALAILAALILLVVIFVLARRLVRWAQRTEVGGTWQPVHRSLTNGEVAIRLECPGQAPLVLRTLDPADDDFDDRLHEAMAEARQRAAALNSERSLPR
ncbi:MAG TPA: hypothetical protein VF545_02790 [Thermoleophilaceae bacterium]|jgi:hypothetical protein